MFQTHLNLTADTLRMQDIASNFQNFLGGGEGAFPQNQIRATRKAALIGLLTKWLNY